MALIKCKDCKNKFSTDAKHCPHCGAKKKGSWSFWFVILLLCCYVAYHEPGTSRRPANPLPATPANITAIQPTGWQVQEDRSPMDDSQTVAISKDADNRIEVWLKTVKPNLIIRCKEKKTELYLHTGSATMPEVGKFHKYTVEIRIDTQPMYKELWEESTSSDSLFAPNSIGFTRKLAKAKKLLIRFTPFNAPPATAEFDLGGLDTMLPKVANICKWSAAQ